MRELEGAFDAGEVADLRAESPTAESLSMPRRQRSLASGPAQGESGTSSLIIASSLSRPTTSASIAPS